MSRIDAALRLARAKKGHPEADWLDLTPAAQPSDWDLEILTSESDRLGPEIASEMSAAAPSVAEPDAPPDAPTVVIAAHVPAPPVAAPAKEGPAGRLDAPPERDADTTLLEWPATVVVQPPPATPPTVDDKAAFELKQLVERVREAPAPPAPPKSHDSMFAALDRVLRESPLATRRREAPGSEIVQNTDTAPSDDRKSSSTSVREDY